MRRSERGLQTFIGPLTLAIKSTCVYQISHVQFVTLWHLQAYLFTSVVVKLQWCFIDRWYIQPTAHNQATFPHRCSVQFSLIGSSLLVVLELERCYSPTGDFTTHPFITALSVMWYIMTTGLHTCWHAWWNTRAGYKQEGFYYFLTALIVINQAAPSWLLNAIIFYQATLICSNSSADVYWCLPIGSLLHLSLSDNSFVSSLNVKGYN